MPDTAMWFFGGIGIMVIAGIGYFLLTRHEAAKESREYFRRENEKARREGLD